MLGMYRFTVVSDRQGGDRQQAVYIFILTGAFDKFCQIDRPATSTSSSIGRKLPDMEGQYVHESFIISQTLPRNVVFYLSPDIWCLAE